MEPEDPVYAALYSYTRALSVALGHRDTLTQLHSERVRGLCEVIGRACGLSKSELGILKIAASFHDIGKIGIPDSVLLKPAQFEPSEWETMKQHSQIGWEIMSVTQLQGAHEAALAIRQHHEHYDGRGYPDQLAGEAISISARIISIADSYDAMAQTRSYHRSKPHALIMPILHRETGEKHDPHLMRVFCKLIESSEFKAAC